MPRGKKVKKEDKTPQVVQTVKVVVGDVSKRKRKYKKRSGPSKKHIAPMTEVRGGLQNTIYGEPVPLPPRIIEVPVPYGLSAGSTPATGVFPSRPSAPSIESPPAPPALPPASMPSMPSIMAGEKPKSMIAFPSSSAEIDALDSGESYMIKKALEKKESFYKPHERRGEEGYIWYKQPQPPSEPIITEVSSKSKNKSKTSTQEPIIINMGKEEEFVTEEVKQKPSSLFKSVMEGTTPRLMKKDTASEFKTIISTAASEGAQKVGEFAAEKTGETAGGFLGSTLSAILPEGLKPIGKAVGGIAGSIVSKTLKSKIPKKKEQEQEEPSDVVTESIKKIKERKLPNWNVTKTLTNKYANDFNVSENDAAKFLKGVQKKYPSAHPKDIINAIENKDFSMFA